MSPAPSDVLVVSALTRVRWVGGLLEISAAGKTGRLVASDVDVVAVLHAFAQARSVRDALGALPSIRPDDLIAVVAQLRSADVLVPPVSSAVSSAVLAARGGARIVLGRRPDVAGPGFRSLLDSRASRRAWNAEPIPSDLFGEFLWLSARNRTNGDGVSRPYPSGGGTHSLELYPVLAPRSVAGIAAGIYRYRPGAHTLETVSTGYGPLLQAAATALDAGDPPVAILITSRFEQVSATYGELAYSLVLTETGCLVQTMYLVAEYLGLGACAVGGDPPDVPDLIEPVVGQLVLGPRAS